MTAPSILDRPFVAFGREIAADLEPALRREWLVTNGIGSYASGTVAGVPTRRYHGLLVVALEPPVERTVLVAGALETLLDRDSRVELASLERRTRGRDDAGDGIPVRAGARARGARIEPDGWRHTEAFALEGTIPVWRIAAGDLLVERRVWMPAGEQATWVAYRSPASFPAGSQAGRASQTRTAGRRTHAGPRLDRSGLVRVWQTRDEASASACPPLGAR